MPLFSRNTDSHSNPGQSDAGSQHSIKPQSTHKQFKISVPRLFSRSRHHDPATEVPAVDITALGVGQVVPVGHEQHASVDIANDAPQAPATLHDSCNPASMQTEGRNPVPSIAEPVTVPVTTQFQDAHGVNISGNPQFTNIGVNHSVNFYGGTHGLENLKDFVSFAALHDSAEQDPKRRCHPGTRKNVLSKLRDWFDNPNTTESICWLYGPAGAGKSAIAQTIANEYKERGLAATFFFYRSDAERNNGNRLFPTLAWQLAFSIPAIKNFIVHALDNTPHLPRKDIETQFEQLIVHPFQPTNNAASQPAPVIIIDGLDECSNEELQRRILTVIGNAVKDSRVPLHFFICSRPEALIEDVLDRFKDFTLRIDLATLDDSNRDIEKYLLDQFSDIASKRGLVPTWPGPEIIEEFVDKSSGNFILAATVMRYISDEDCDPEEQLDIVRNLKSHGNTSPFALLDELYMEILKQQRDQNFLKTFLALLVGRSSIDARDLQEDDATLMNVSEKNLHLKLRRMRSLLKFEPFIDVHHKSFLDFLQDPSRSGQYHVSKQDGQKRYLELIAKCVVRHVSTAIEQPNGHEECGSRPKFGSIVKEYPPKIVLPVKDWREASEPLLVLQNRLLSIRKPQPCGFFQAMRELLLHLTILQRNSHHSAAVQVLDLNMNEPLMEQSTALVTDVTSNIPENDLDRCLSALHSCLQKTNSELAVDAVMIERISSLLAFDHAEAVTRVRSVSEAQKLIDIINLLIRNQTFLSHCGPDAASKAALLASAIYSRIPLLPCSVFMSGPTQQCDWLLELKRLPSAGLPRLLLEAILHISTFQSLELAYQSTVISRILDHNYTIPLLWVYQGDKLKFVYGKVNEQDESVDKWLERSRPKFVTRIRVMLEIGRAIRYIHSMDVVTGLSSAVIGSNYITLDSNLRAKVMFFGHFSRQVMEYLITEKDFAAECTPKSNIAAFAHLFEKVCFRGDNENHPNHLVEDARKLIERCSVNDPKRRPTMVDVVKEMETWDLT